MAFGRLLAAIPDVILANTLVLFIGATARRRRCAIWFPRCPPGQGHGVPRGRSGALHRLGRGNCRGPLPPRAGQRHGPVRHPRRVGGRRCGSGQGRGFHQLRGGAERGRGAGNARAQASLHRGACQAAVPRRPAAQDGCARPARPALQADSHQRRRRTIRPDCRPAGDRQSAGRRTVRGSAL